MKKKTLFEQWPKLGDENLSSFLSLLKVSDIEDQIQADEQSNRSNVFGIVNLSKVLLRDGKIDEEKLKHNLIDVEKLKHDLIEKRLKEIERHSLFKLVLKNEHFKDSLEWVEKRREYKKGCPEIKIKFIKSVASAITRHSERLKGTEGDRDNSEAVKDLQKLAQKLMEKITEVENTLENPLQWCCEYTFKGLKFMSDYRPTKALRKDETHADRIFLYDLINQFISNDLPRLPVLFIKLLEMAGTPTPNKRQLIVNIRSFERAITANNGKMRVWVLTKDVGK